MPFSLIYDVEAILPLEVEIPSLRVSLEEFTDKEFQREACLLELDKLDETRLQDVMNQIHNMKMIIKTSREAYECTEGINKQKLYIFN